jgi:hypothetical protein
LGDSYNPIGQNQDSDNILIFKIVQILFIKYSFGLSLLLSEILQYQLENRRGRMGELAKESLYTNGCFPPFNQDYQKLENIEK